MKERYKGLDVLRCLLTVMIIVLHFNHRTMGGGFEYTSSKPFYFLTLAVLEAASIGAVNVYLLMSGFLMCESEKIRISKIVYLLLTVNMYAVFLYVVGSVLGVYPFDVKTAIKYLILPANYFLMLYCAVYILSPFINRMIKQLNQKQFQILVGIMLFLFCVWPTISTLAETKLGINMFGTSFISMYGDDEGYTLVNFLMCYLIGAYIRKFGKRKKLFGQIAGYLFSVILLTIGQYITANVLDYCNVFVVINAVCLFNIFKNIELKNTKIFTFLAKSSFSVFVIHTNYLMLKVFWGKFNIPVLCEQEYLLFLLGVAICVMAMYIACIIIDNICRVCVKPICKLLDKIPFMQWKIELKEE